MKLRSVIWTYILLSILYLSKTETDNGNNSNAFLSLQDKKIAKIDSVYRSLTLESRIKLLSINSLSGKENDSILFNSNGFITHSDQSDIFVKKIQDQSDAGFEKTKLRIGHSGLSQQLVNNLAIGQTNELKLAQYKQAIISEKLKSDGYNIVLGNFFQTYDTKLDNESVAYTQSPLSSEKYWQAMLAGAEENGVKIGISDPFMLDIAVDSTDAIEFQAIGLSGNRYYARRGHGIIQLNANQHDFATRIRSKGKNKQAFLRENYKFEGLIISPDLSKFSKDNQAKEALKSIQSGTDLVCVSLEIQQELDSLLKIYFKANEVQLKESCTRVLKLKYDLNENRAKETSVNKYSKAFEYQTLQASLSCILNSDNLLPIKNLNQSIYYFTSNDRIPFIEAQLNHYSSVKTAENLQKTQTGICIVDGFGDNLIDALKWSKKHDGDIKLILVTDQIAAIKHRTNKLDMFEAILISGDSTMLSQEIAIQALFGAYSSKGKLPFYLSPKFPMSTGLELGSLARLAYVAPEYVGISPEKMNEIDIIVEAGISAKAFPGCQVIVGFEGKIIYEKAFGSQDFSQNSKIDQQTIYDIASITKIAASTTSLMKLQGDSLFSLSKTLGDYIPEIVGNTPFANILIKDMMAHQAGLPAWIPFYLKTLKGGKPDPYYYSKTKTTEYSVPVAKDLWIKSHYPDTLYDRILSSNLKSKSYVYSDLGYYFVKKIIEKLSKKKMEDYVQDSIYSQLGLQTMTYNPYLKFDLSRIAPTEDDKIFRKQVLRGYVHDPGSAMMGGVGGHAGIFSTANDLAILMQMMLNGGYYGGKQILKKDVLDEYTSVQFPNTNRRGAGFDKPNLNGTEATACAMASPVSYGHSGFTGTLAWADPKYKINYVFLSNRVYPDAENWKIVRMDIRTKIQTKIYQAVQSADNFNFLQ